MCIKLKKITCIFLITVMVFSLVSCSEKKVSSTEFAMNTFVSITAYGDNADKAIKAAFSEVKRIEKLVSCHIEDSEISLVNKNAAVSPVSVSDETAYVLREALAICEKTDGAFDISVKPLVDLWDVNAENPTVPSEEDIQAARKLVNYKNIILDGNSVSFAVEGMQIDLGAAAKGYCADKVAQTLERCGVKNAMIDLGGNIYAMGKNEQGEPWRIGLQNPSGERGEHFAMENISDKTAVTSGSYERYFEKDGKIYHHIIDPHTGYPAESGLISVTVIGKSSFEADMLSTAVFVMGSEAFKNISEEFNYDKIICVDKNNRALVVK